MTDIRAANYSDGDSWFAALPAESQESALSAGVAGDCSLQEIWELLVRIEPRCSEASNAELRAELMGAIRG